MEIPLKDAQLLAIITRLQAKGETNRAIKYSKYITTNSYAKKIANSILNPGTETDQTIIKIAKDYQHWAKHGLLPRD